MPGPVGRTVRTTRNFSNATAARAARTASTVRRIDDRIRRIAGAFIEDDRARTTPQSAFC